ncbi:MAG TPA: TIGR03088 family PEP-CTERM/XrtA system glycosyltransferase [Burkholderiales bacterium]|nr:TIGR03088 family PEP-CTERM/XrtA system glycosyltransferase [Burkholderiales bacterium]
MSQHAPLIAHIVYRFGIGGLENGIVNLVNRMPRERWRHVIIALTEVSHEFAERIERADVRYIELGKRPGHLVRDYPRLYRLFRQMQPAIVHTRNLAALEAAAPAWAAQVPVRIHGEHGWDANDPDGKRWRYRGVRRLYRPFVQRYVALSRHLADYLERGVGVGRERISQMYNGVDTTRFSPTESRAPIAGAPFGAADEWLVGWVGRMDPVKDALNLARAFVRARELSPAAAKRMRLVLVGDGPQRAALASLFEERRVSEHVWFAGERNDIAEVMRGLDCFVLPSRAEGVSNTILEAMASRLPIVATRVGGNAELLESGMTGLLVPPADSDALARAILTYFTERSTARRHAKAARHVAETRFSLERMVADYTNLYANALAAAGIVVPAPVEALASTR